MKKEMGGRERQKNKREGEGRTEMGRKHLASYFYNLTTNN